MRLSYEAALAHAGMAPRPGTVLLNRSIRYGNGATGAPGAFSPRAGMGVLTEDMAIGSTTIMEAEADRLKRYVHARGVVGTRTAYDRRAAGLRGVGNSFIAMEHPGVAEIEEFAQARIHRGYLPPPQLHLPFGVPMPVIVKRGGWTAGPAWRGALPGTPAEPGVLEVGTPAPYYGPATYTDPVVAPLPVSLARGATPAPFLESPMPVPVVPDDDGSPYAPPRRAVATATVAVEDRAGTVVEKKRGNGVWIGLGLLGLGLIFLGGKK